MNSHELIGQMLVRNFPDDILTSRSRTCLYIDEFTGISCGRDGGPVCPQHEFHYLCLREFLSNLQVPEQGEHETVGNIDEPQQQVPNLTRIWEPVVETQISIISWRAPKISKLSDMTVIPQIENVCPVCIDGTENLLSLPCRHVICFECYRQLQTDNCPVCRAEIVHSFIRKL